MENFELSKENQKNSSLKEVQRIVESRNTVILKREQIQDLVETPLLKASQIFYDKNIETLSSSANGKDIETGDAYIIIEFSSMSLENQEIAKKYGEVIDYDNMKAIKISFPINEHTSMLDLEQKAIEIANSFEKQSMLWAPKYTIKELKKHYGIDQEDKSYDGPKGWEKEGYYYDKENNIFYLSEEHYQKVKEKIEKK